MVAPGPFLEMRPAAQALAAEAVLVEVPLGVALEMCKMAVTDLDDEERRAEALAVWAALKVDGAQAIADVARDRVTETRRGTQARAAPNLWLDGEDFSEMLRPPAFPDEKPGMMGPEAARWWFLFILALALLGAGLVLT